MGNKYSVKVWGQHWKDLGLQNQSYSYLQVWGGESLVRAFWELLKARRLGYGCTVLEIR